MIRHSKRALKEQLDLFTDASRLRIPAFAVINKVQEHKPADQMLGTAVALLVMAEETGLDVRTLLEKAERAVRDAESPFTSHVPALRAYARNELLGGI